MKKLISTAVAMLLSFGMTPGLYANDDRGHDRFEFRPDTLVLSRSVYAGTASTVTVGQTLPPGCVAGTVAVPLIGSATTTNVKVKCAAATENGEYPNLA